MVTKIAQLSSTFGSGITKNLFIETVMIMMREIKGGKVSNYRNLLSSSNEANKELKKIRSAKRRIGAADYFGFRLSELDPSEKTQNSYHFGTS